MCRCGLPFWPIRQAAAIPTTRPAISTPADQGLGILAGTLLGLPAVPIGFSCPHILVDPVTSVSGQEVMGGGV